MLGFRLDLPGGRGRRGHQHLLQVTEESLYLALEAAVVGNHVGDIGAAVMARVDGTGYGIIRDLVGHGLGRELHEEPQVPNVGKAGHGPPLMEGMVLAIEPMLGAGTDQIRTLEDRWTVISADRGRSAHFEHTMAVTRGGTEGPDRAGSGRVQGASGSPTVNPGSVDRFRVDPCG